MASQVKACWPLTDPGANPTLERVSTNGLVPRLWVLSDTHTDHGANMRLVERLLPPKSRDHYDVLLCAGDVSVID